MRISSIFSSLLMAGLAMAEVRSASLFLQPIDGAASSPISLASIQYDIDDPTFATISEYEAPEIPEDTKLVRIGLYSASSSQWISSTTVASVANFEKGYLPTFTLAIDAAGNVISAACSGVAVDAGVTRDFAPKVIVQVEGLGKQPDLNKPVVISPEGKKVVEEEKTLLQKYWWVIAAAVFMLVTSGGDGK